MAIAFSPESRKPLGFQGQHVDYIESDQQNDAEKNNDRCGSLEIKIQHKKRPALCVIY